MKKKVVLIYIDVYERFLFFSKCLDVLDKLGLEVWIATARYSIVRALRHQTDNILILTRMSDTADVVIPVEYANSLSVLNDYHNLQEAESIGRDVWIKLEMFFQNVPLQMLWIWNGATTIAMTLGTFARAHGIATRYFEISNLGERIFVDKEGTSGASYLAAHPEILDHVSIDEKEYDAWLNIFHSRYTVPKQAANRSKIPWQVVIDLVGYAKGCIREDRRNTWKLLWGKVRNKLFTQHWPDAALTQPYVFLPLQVAGDAQLKLFSAYSNMDMIREALTICKNAHLRLVVKIHPAESDRVAIDAVKALQRAEDFVIAGNSTLELIRHSSFVIVNNSTVGLEAMIEGKRVKVYGNALYRHFTQARLKAYILHYLLPGDYFGDTPIPADTVKKILLDSWWETEESK